MLVVGEVNERVIEEDFFFSGDKDVFFLRGIRCILWFWKVVRDRWIWFFVYSLLKVNYEVISDF